MKHLIYLFTLTIFIGCSGKDESLNFPSELPSELKKGPIVNDYTPREKIAPQTNYVFENHANQESISQTTSDQLSIALSEVEQLSEVLNESVGINSAMIPFSTIHTNGVAIQERNENVDSILEKLTFHFEFIAKEDLQTGRPILFMIAKYRQPVHSVNFRNVRVPFMESVYWSCAELKLPMQLFADIDHLKDILRRLGIDSDKYKDLFALPLKNNTTHMDQELFSPHNLINPEDYQNHLTYSSILNKRQVMNFTFSQDQFVNAEEVTKKYAKVSGHMEFSFACHMKF